MKFFAGSKKLILIHSLAGLIFLLLLIFALSCLKNKSGLSSVFLNKQTGGEKKEEEIIPLREVKSGLLPNDFSLFLYKNYPLLFQYCEIEAINVGLTGYDFQIQTYKADLNSDGQLEYFIFPLQICGQDVRGISGNGPISLYEKKGENWEEVASFEADSVVLLNEKTDGYYNFQGHSKMSADSGYTTDYQYFKNREEYTFKYFPVNQKWYYYGPDYQPPITEETKTETPQSTKMPDRSPTQTVELFMKRTLGIIPGSDLDYEKSKQYLTKGLKADFYDSSFVPISYCIQLCPDQVRVSAEHIVDQEAQVRVQAQWANNDFADKWDFMLKLENNQWLIDQIKCLMQ